MSVDLPNVVGGVQGDRKTCDPGAPRKKQQAAAMRDPPNMPAASTRLATNS